MSLLDLAILAAIYLPIVGGLWAIARWNRPSWRRPPRVPRVAANERRRWWQRNTVVRRQR